MLFTSTARRDFEFASHLAGRRGQGEWAANRCIGRDRSRSSAVHAGASWPLSKRPPPRSGERSAGLPLEWAAPRSRRRSAASACLAKRSISEALKNHRLRHEVRRAWPAWPARCRRELLKCDRDPVKNSRAKVLSLSRLPAQFQGRSAYSCVVPVAAL